MSRFAPNRRQFLGLAAAAGAAPYWLTARQAGADEPKSAADRPLIGWIGAGGRGTAVVQQAAQFGRVAAICDVDLAQAEKAQAKLFPKADVCQDYRRLLDRKDLDVIVNATPDHWHTAISVAACKAGRDVYAEKPMTLTIDEGKILRKVVQETGRVVQIGT